VERLGAVMLDVSFAFTASQSSGNFPKRMGSTQLARAWFKLASTSKSSGMTFGFFSFTACWKRFENSYKLAKYATKSTHWWPLWCGVLAESIYISKRMGYFKNLIWASLNHPTIFSQRTK
jgi:hypothetical protein